VALKEISVDFVTNSLNYNRADTCRFYSVCLCVCVCILLTIWLQYYFWIVQFSYVMSDVHLLVKYIKLLNHSCLALKCWMNPTRIICIILVQHSFHCEAENVHFCMHDFEFVRLSVCPQYVWSLRVWKICSGSSVGMFPRAWR